MYTNAIYSTVVYCSNHAASTSKPPTRCFSYSAMLPDFRADVTSCVQKIMSWAQNEFCFHHLQPSAFPAFPKLSCCLIFVICSGDILASQGKKLYMVNRNPKIRRKSLFLLQVFRGVICVDESRTVSTWQYLAWIIWIFSCISGTEKY